MISQPALEDAILAILCFSEAAPKISLKLPSHYIFTNPSNQEIAKACLDYLSRFGVAPKQAIDLLLENQINQAGRGKLISQQLEILSKKVDGLDIEFVVDELDRFVEKQQLQKNLQNAIELLDADDLDGAKAAAYKQNVQQRVNGTPGIWIADPRQALSFMRKHEEGEFFSTGIQVLDRRRITLERKTLSFLIAAKGEGKSWWLVNIGKAALQHHHKILHITLEMSEEKTCRRYVQSLFALTKDETRKIVVPLFEKDLATGAVSINRVEIERESIFAKKKEVENKLAMMSHSQLMIKEFPTGTLTTDHLYLFLDQLKRERNFVPDEVLIDYADLMKIDRKDIRVDTGRQYIELRGLATSENKSLVTATQGNRESAHSKLVRNTNVAEDWSKIATADLVVTLTRTPAERVMGLARIFVENCREVEDKFTILISQDYHIGQFCIDSTVMTTELSQQLDTSQNQVS